MTIINEDKQEDVLMKLNDNGNVVELDSESLKKDQVAGSYRGGIFKLTIKGKLHILRINSDFTRMDAEL